MSKPPSFQALDECHRRILAHLDRLEALLARLDSVGLDDAARAEALCIEAFFSETARAHHREEELRVFPALLASSDSTVVTAIHLLQQDHGWIEEDWHELAPQLRAVAAGYSWYEPAELRHGITVFVQLCREHILLEESVIYPQARALAAAFERRRAERAAQRVTPEERSSS